MGIENILGIGITVLSKAEKEENLRVSFASKKYIGTQPSEWPFSAPLWNLTREAQRYVTSDRTETAFLREHPKGLLLMTVSFKELDTRLVTAFRRAPTELWTAHDSNKIAQIIFRWSEGTTLTPPLLRPFSEFGREITITDGSHRLALSRALRTETLHVLIKPDACSEMKEMLPSLQLIR